MYHNLREQLGDILIFAGLSFVFALTKLVLAPEPRSIRVSMITILIGVVIGTLAGGLALGFGWGDYVALSCSSFASLLSRDFVVGVMNNKNFLGNLIKHAAENLTDKVTK
jgi:uncharacterized membrane protein YfcA